jgi:hypothetical protein
MLGRLLKCPFFSCALIYEFTYMLLVVKCKAASETYTNSEGRHYEPTLWGINVYLCALILEMKR